MTESLTREAQSELRAFAEDQMALVRNYEKHKSFEAAYLARWAIAERFVKTVAAEHREATLRAALWEWTQYLDGTETERPSSKLDTTLESFSLPNKKEFKVSLESYGFDADSIWKVMDSGGQPRRRRNEIAHTGKRFSRVDYYERLAVEVQAVVDIVLRLSP